MPVINIYFIMKALEYSKRTLCSRLINYMNRPMNVLIGRLNRPKKIYLWLKGYQIFTKNWTNIHLKSGIQYT